MRTATWLLAVLALSAPLCGCKKAKQRFFERSAEQATGADDVQLEEDGKRVTLSSRSDGGDSEIELGQAARIPADFPSRVPIYPGSKIVAAMGMTDQGKRSHVVTLSAAAPSSAVLDFYKQRLADIGKVREVSLGGLRMLSVDDQKGLSVNVTVTPNGDQGSTIQLTTTPN